MKNTRTVQPSAGAYGFTLIELLVTVSIIGLLVALLIPAVLAAREAERRGRCAGNLRQVGIALHSYSGTFGSLPPGRMMTYDPRFSGAAPPCTSQMVDKSLFVQILPFLEQAPIYHAVNCQVTIFGWENETVRLVEVSTFACPTDPGATVREGHSLPLLSYGLETPGKPYPVFFGSYAGMYGSLFVNAIPTPATRCEVPRSVLAQVNGAFNDSSPSDSSRSPMAFP